MIDLAQRFLLHHQSFCCHRNCCRSSVVSPSYVSSSLVGRSTRCFEVHQSSIVVDYRSFLDGHSGRLARYYSSSYLLYNSRHVSSCPSFRIDYHVRRIFLYHYTSSVRRSYASYVRHCKHYRTLVVRNSSSRVLDSERRLQISSSLRPISKDGRNKVHR